MREPHLEHIAKLRLFKLTATYSGKNKLTVFGGFVVMCW